MALPRIPRRRVDDRRPGGRQRQRHLGDDLWPATDPAPRERWTSSALTSLLSGSRELFCQAWPNADVAACLMSPPPSHSSPPCQATYGAAKAFVLSFSQALWQETRHRSVAVTALCPGPTRQVSWMLSETLRRQTATCARLGEPGRSSTLGAAQERRRADHGGLLDARGAGSAAASAASARPPNSSASSWAEWSSRRVHSSMPRWNKVRIGGRPAVGLVLELRPEHPGALAGQAR